MAISTGGKSPAAARLVKERIAAMLGAEHAALVRLLGAHRDAMKAQVPGQGRRARAWKRMLDEGVLESLRTGNGRAALATLRRCVADAACGKAGVAGSSAPGPRSRHGDVPGRARRTAARR